MRKYMTKVVTSTTVKCAKTEMKDSKPYAIPVDDFILIGNYSIEKAQDEIRGEHGDNVVVLSVKPQTIQYEMAVEDFIALATPVSEYESSREE